MNRPNFDNILECFVSIPDSEDNLEQWNNHIECLRLFIIPLIKNLRQQELIEWYSFLVHGKQHISSTFIGPSISYVHLRMEIAEYAAMEHVQNLLPEYCLEARKMSPPERPILDSIDVGTLRDGAVEEGWRILGEASEWVLRTIEGHDLNQPIPVQNIHQFIHYLNNSIMGRAIGIPM